VFFDDYANVLIVGNTMRPVTDKLKISREKLSYLVDSTAAPVTSIAFVTTWIGAELSYIQSSLTDLGLSESAYHIFLSSIKYSFYPILTLIFAFIIIYYKKDFGSMYRAEMRARSKGVNAASSEKKIECDLKELENVNTSPAKAYNALIPIGTIVLVTIIGLFYTGWDSRIWHDNSIGFLNKLSGIIGASNSYKALLWASFSGLLVAIFMTIVQKIMNLKDCAESMLSGFKTMLSAILILTLAWSLSSLVSDMHTADFFVLLISSTNLSPVFIPFISFLMSAVISFSIGSSWGTMAVMYPLILPATWLLSVKAGMDHEQSMFLFTHVVATVIAGSVFGDHCSPISDTTILSSLASSCNHIQHVRTQLPYALVVAAISLFCGILPISFGIPIWLVMPFSIFVIWGTVRVFGKKTE
jgi:Na+/H+ antiporter NhaC